MSCVVEVTLFPLVLKGAEDGEWICALYPSAAMR